ncbi:MAG: helix-turn-helix domain-containing protein [Pseudonocardiaceae bacterium]
MSDSPAHPELAATLRRLRRDAGLSGIEAARRAGLSQPTVSRLETGRRAPTVKEVTALCKAYRAPAEVRAALQATARDLQEGITSARIVLQRPCEMQERIGRIEQSSALFSLVNQRGIIVIHLFGSLIRSFSATASCNRLFFSGFRSFGRDFSVSYRSCAACTR